MIKSMTGFGKAVTQVGDKNLSVEIRTLNSKTLDLSLRLPLQYKDKEQELRNLLARSLVRGKAELSFEEAGTYTISAESGDYVSATMQLEVAPASNLDWLLWVLVIAVIVIAALFVIRFVNMSGRGGKGYRANRYRRGKPSLSKV